MPKRNEENRRVFLKDTREDIPQSNRPMPENLLRELERQAEESDKSRDDNKGQDSNK